MDSWERPRGGYRRPPLGGDRRPNGQRAPASCAHFLKHRLGTSGWRLFSCLLIGCAAAVIIIIASLLVVFFVNPARKFSEDDSSRSNESRTAAPPPAIVFGHQRASSTMSPLHKPKLPLHPTINYPKYKDVERRRVGVLAKSTSTSSSPITSTQDEGQGEAIPVIDTSLMVHTTPGTTTDFMPLPQQVTQFIELSTMHNINSDVSESPLLVTQPILVDAVEHRTFATLSHTSQTQPVEERMEIETMDITTSLPESEIEESETIEVDNTGWKPLLAKDVVQAWLMHRILAPTSSSTQHSTTELLTQSSVDYSTHNSTEYSPEHIAKSSTQMSTEYITEPSTTQQFTINYSTESSTEDITTMSYTEPSNQSSSIQQSMEETSTQQETEPEHSTQEAISSTVPPIIQTILTTSDVPERGRKTKTNSSPFGVGEVLEVDIGVDKEQDQEQDKEQDKEQTPPTLTVTGGDVRVGDPVEYHASSSSFWDSGSEIDAKSVSSDLEARASQTITVLDSYSEQDGDQEQEQEQEHFAEEHWHS